MDAVFTVWHAECIVLDRMESKMETIKGQRLLAFVKAYDASERVNASIPSWSVIVNGVVVWAGGYGRAKREADKRGGTLRPSDTCIMVSV